MSKLEFGLGQSADTEQVDVNRRRCCTNAACLASIVKEQFTTTDQIPAQIPRPGFFTGIKAKVIVLPKPLLLSMGFQRLRYFEAAPLP